MSRAVQTDNYDVAAVILLFYRCYRAVFPVAIRQKIQQ